jgi:hypothetical protein
MRRLRLGCNAARAWSSAHTLTNHLNIPSGIERTWTGKVTRVFQLAVAGHAGELLAMLQVNIEVSMNAFDAWKFLTFCISGAARRIQRSLELSAGRRISIAQDFEY